MPAAKVEISVLDVEQFQDFLLRVLDFVEEYAWHSRSCAAVDADGDWRIGNPACDCGYDEAKASLQP